MTVTFKERDAEVGLEVVVSSSGQIELSYTYPESNRTVWFNTSEQAVTRESGAIREDLKQQFLQVASDFGRSMFVPSFRSAGGPGGQQFDIHVGTDFIRQWDSMKRSASEKVTHENIEQVTGEIAKLLGASKLSIDAAGDFSNFILLENGKSYRLDEVGAGMAHSILVLTTVALARPTYLCIDEPEAGLHPSLQIDFLTALGRYASKGLWIATHSYGLARSVADQMFVVRKSGVESELVRWESASNLSVLLGELSYGSYLALGGAKVLLVEGPTEVKCYQQFLRMLGKDREVIVLSMFGHQLIDGGREHELSEVKRITTDVYAIIDSEYTKTDDKLGEKRRKFAAMCEAQKIKCHVLERSATENYFTDRATRAVNPNYRSLGPFEKPKKGTAEWWGKDKNWRVAQEMTKEELLATDLGKFLAGIYTTTLTIRLPEAAAESVDVYFLSP